MLACLVFVVLASNDECVMCNVFFLPGKGNIRLTGSLGDVMKESVFTALSWIRAHDRKVQQLLWTATGLNVTLTPEGSTDDENLLSKSDLHIHFPSGAVKKASYRGSHESNHMHKRFT